MVVSVVVVVVLALHLDCPQTNKRLCATLAGNRAVTSCLAVLD